MPPPFDYPPPHGGHPPFGGRGRGRGGRMVNYNIHVNMIIKIMG